MPSSDGKIVGNTSIVKQTALAVEPLSKGVGKVDENSKLSASAHPERPPLAQKRTNDSTTLGDPKKKKNSNDSRSTPTRAILHHFASACQQLT